MFQLLKILAKAKEFEMLRAQGFWRHPYAQRDPIENLREGSQEWWWYTQEKICLELQEVYLVEFYLNRVNPYNVENLRMKRIVRISSPKQRDHAVKEHIE
jgi:hypothetical protein